MFPAASPLSTRLRIGAGVSSAGSPIVKEIHPGVAAASAEKRLIPEGLKSTTVVFLDSDIQTPQHTFNHNRYHLNHTTLD